MSKIVPEIVLKGRAPQEKPPRVQDFEELDKKSIDSLIDYMKYVATASGITMGFYAKTVADGLKANAPDLTKLILFAPVLFWFMAILFSVIGVFPRTYLARTDAEKESAVDAIRSIKSWYSIASISFFLLGFLMFVCSTAASLWNFLPQ
jgi:hypothetical protein